VFRLPLLLLLLLLLPHCCQHFWPLLLQSRHKTIMQSAPARKKEQGKGEQWAAQGV
jgi:hypothetical protein